MPSNLLKVTGLEIEVLQQLFNIQFESIPGVRCKAYITKVCKKKGKYTALARFGANVVVSQLKAKNPSVPAIFHVTYLLNVSNLSHT